MTSGVHATPYLDTHVIQPAPGDPLPWAPIKECLAWQLLAAPTAASLSWTPPPPLPPFTSLIAKPMSSSQAARPPAPPTASSLSLAATARALAPAFSSFFRPSNIW